MDSMTYVSSIGDNVISIGDRHAIVLRDGTASVYANGSDNPIASWECRADMASAFTWNSGGGCMIDVIALVDGSVLSITDEAVLYEPYDSMNEPCPRCDDWHDFGTIGDDVCDCWSDWGLRSTWLVK